MEAILKVQLQCVAKQYAKLPVGAKVLCVQTQREEPCMWFITPNAGDTPPMELRTFAIYGTGLQYESIGGEYIGTSSYEVVRWRTMFLKRNKERQFTSANNRMAAVVMMASYREYITAFLLKEASACQK